MTKAKATKLDKEIQEGLYDPKKPATAKQSHVYKVGWKAKTGFKTKSFWTKKEMDKQVAVLKKAGVWHRAWQAGTDKVYDIKGIADNLRRQGIEPDLIDIEAEYDHNLSHSENLKRIKSLIGARTKRSYRDYSAMQKQFYRGTGKLINASPEERAAAFAQMRADGTLRGYDPSQRIFASDGIRGEIFKSNVKKNIHGTDKPYELIITMDIGLESPNWVRTYQERFKTIAKAQKEAMKIFAKRKKKTAQRGYDPKRERTYIAWNIKEQKPVGWLGTAKSWNEMEDRLKKYKAPDHITSKRLFDPKPSSIPPTGWYEAMVRGIKRSSDVRNPYAIVKNIWSKLSPSKKAEIKARERTGERFKYNLPLPVDKPTRGTGTVRMVKPFKLAEVQVNLSVNDYLSALKSGIFSRMKRQDGTTALVARCKSPDKNVNIFVDKAGK